MRKEAPMDNSVYFPLLVVMVVVTYLIRALPFVLFKKKITNKRVKAFLDYIPYTVLSSMTFPAMLYSTGNIAAASCGLLTAMMLSWKNKSLLVVAMGTCAVTFMVALLLR